MNRSLLSKAVANTETPTPGYMFQEIAKMTLNSAEASFKIEKFLFSKLRRGGPNVKWKALNIIKHVAMKGRADFKRNCIQKAAEIKTLLQFRGEKDPIKGDQANLQVRKAAKAALGAIFSTSQKAPARSKGAASRFAGISSDSYGKSSTQAPAPVPASSWSFRSSSKAASSAPPLGSPPTGWSFSSNRGARAVQKAQPSYAAPESSFDPRSPGRSRQKKADDVHVATKKTTRRGPRKGVRGDWGTSAGLKSSQSVRRPSRESAISSGGGRSNSDPVSCRNMGNVGTAVSDGVFENNLVEQLVSAGGVRVEPPKAKLEQFCRRCRTLRPKIVAPLLAKKLAASKWQTRIKTLAVISALAHDRLCKPFRNYFEEMDSSWLLDLVQDDPSKKVRARACKVFTYLYPEDDIDGDEGEEAPEAPEAPETDDFLGLSDDNAGDAGQFSEEEEEGLGTSDLFGGLSLADGDDNDNVDGDDGDDDDDVMGSGGGGGFAFMQSSGADGAEQHGGGDDALDDDDDDDGMFGGMHMGGESTNEAGRSSAKLLAAPTPSPSPGRSNDLSDLFSGSGGDVAAPTPPAASSAGGAGSGIDLFSNFGCASATPTPAAGGFPGMTGQSSHFGTMGGGGARPMLAPPMRRRTSRDASQMQARRMPAPSGNAGVSMANTRASGTGFGFMQQQKMQSNDAFDFVGDLMS